jgi:hypothetical protein
VRVQPGAKRSEFAGQHGTRIKIRLTAPAIANRANEALIAFLAEHYRVPKRCVRIAAGLKSRDKRVLIEGV